MENIVATDAQLYELFRETLGKDKAERTVNHIKTIARSEAASRTEVLATAKQLSDLELRINERFNDFELRMDKRFNESEARVNKRFNDLELRINERFNDSEARVNKRFNESEARVDKRFNDLELRLVDRIHKAQVQTIIWIVTIGVLQFGASYLLRV